MASPKRTRVAIVARIPNPYRNPVYDLLAKEEDLDVHLYFCSPLEPNRQWVLAPTKAPTVFLRERMIVLGDNRFVHLNPDVWRHLRRFRPDIVVTNGYNVTDLIALLYAMTHRARHVSHTDGTVESESSLTSAHRFVRRLVAKVTSAYIGPSRSSTNLFASWGVAPEAVFISPLAVDNSAFAEPSAVYGSDDLLFSGRLTETKNPLFAVEAAARAARELGRDVSVRFVGDGPLASAVSSAARELGVPVRMCGFAEQQELPAAYAGAKVFLCPTRWDPWGLVVNEAAAAGLPILCSPHSGAGAEIVKDGVNGYRLPLDVDVWGRKIADMLRSPELLDRFGTASSSLVKPYSWRESAAGYVAAIRHAGR